MLAQWSCPSPTPETVSIHRAKVGWTVGTGMEAALGGNWTVKVEYLFARFSGSEAVGRLDNANGASAVPGFVDGATFTLALLTAPVGELLVKKGSTTVTSVTPRTPGSGVVAGPALAIH